MEEREVGALLSLGKGNDAPIQPSGTQNSFETSMPIPETVDVHRKVCNCRNSRCLKLYCECFASSLYCLPSCNCMMCMNNTDHMARRIAAINATLERNPDAFKPKIVPKTQSGKVRHMKGCHCKKSGCLKKYCECFQANIRCGDTCKCLNCQNRGASPDKGQGPGAGPAQTATMSGDILGAVRSSQQMVLGQHALGTAARESSSQPQSNSQDILSAREGQTLKRPAPESTEPEKLKRLREVLIEELSPENLEAFTKRVVLSLVDTPARDSSATAPADELACTEELLGDEDGAGPTPGLVSDEEAETRLLAALADHLGAIVHKIEAMG